MQPPDDAALLTEYTARQSEDAFTELVGRHVGLVYSAALRQVREPALAEEVTQAVFIILARKARTVNHYTSLAGWLCRVAHFVSRDALRAERRRLHRERIVTLMDNPPDSEWRHIEPLLDEVVAQLNDRDRNAIVLRFYEQKSLGEVGQALGVDEDAAQKRVSRALEKLRKFFARRGVSATTAIIVGAISANSVHAAPAGLAKSISTVALAKGAAAGGSTLTLAKGALKLMAWTKAKVAVITGAALILTAGTGIVIVREAHSTKVTKAIPPPANGLPETLEQLNAWYVEPPTGQNAATYNLQGFKAMQIKGADRQANLPVLGKVTLPTLPGASLTAPMKSALDAFLPGNRPALQFFGQGAQHEQSRYPIDLTKGSDTLLPHLAQVKKAAQLAQVAAALDAENDDGEQAAGDVLTGLSLARSLQAEPVLISQLVRAASIALAVTGLERSLNHTTLPADSLSALAKVCQDMEDYDARGEGFTRALVGERVTSMTTLKNPDKIAKAFSAGSPDMPADQRRQFLDHLKQSGGLQLELAYFAATFDQVLDARKAAFPERLQVADLFRQRASDAQAQGLVLNALFLGAVGNSVSKEAACLANLRLARTGLALEHYRAAHHRYPTALSELTPEFLDRVLQDPFDGHPLRYRQQGAGYLLYSIGPDLKDDGGKRMTGMGGDLVFTVANPPAS